MPRVCTVCSHPERAAIDQALVAGGVNRRIATQYGMTEASVRRHKDNHVPAKLTRAAEAKETADADDLLRQAGALRTKAMSLLLKAENGGDYRTALTGVREARGCLELLGKLQGQLQDSANINFLVAPAWISIRAELVDVLKAFPDAQEAVLTRLNALEVGDDRVQ